MIQLHEGEKRFCRKLMKRGKKLKSTETVNERGGLCNTHRKCGPRARVSTLSSSSAELWDRSRRSMLLNDLRPSSAPGASRVESLL